MQNQVTEKYTKVTKTAFVSSICCLIYNTFILLIGIFLSFTGIHCSRQDFGACALQNLFADLLAAILALIFGLMIPGGLLLTNTILIIVGWKQKDGRKNLLLPSVGLNVLAFIIVCLIVIVLMLTSSRK